MEEKSSKWKSFQFSLANHFKTVGYFWQALNDQSLVCKMRSKCKVEHMTNPHWLYNSAVVETFLLFTVRRNTTWTSAAGCRREHLHYATVSNNYKSWFPHEMHVPATPTKTTAPQNTTTSLFHYKRDFHGSGVPALHPIRSDNGLQWQLSPSELLILLQCSEEQNLSDSSSEHST